MIHPLLTALLLATAAPPDAATLEINGRSGQQIISVPQLRAALARCGRAIACGDLSIETCDRCYVAAEAVRGGYTIILRTGPPGPLYRLYDKRKRGLAATVFTLRQLTDIFATQLGAPDPAYLGTRDTGEL